MQIALAVGVEIVKEGTYDANHEDALDLSGNRRAWMNQVFIPSSLSASFKWWSRVLLVSKTGA